MERNTQRLTLADGNVRAVLAGRGQHRERNWLDDGDEKRACGVRQTSGLCHWLEDPECVGLAKDHPCHRPLRVRELALQSGEIRGSVGQRG